MRISKKKIENGLTVSVTGYEIRLTLEGYYEIYAIKARRYYSYSNYDLMRRCLNELIK